MLFLFNHDAAHQVAHLAGAAAAMARLCPQHETLVAYGDAGIRATIEGLIDPADTARIDWRELTLPAWREALAAPLNRLLPLRRLWRLTAHADLFASVDMVVSTERTCLRVKRHIRGRMPQFAIVPHGAGDRNVSYHPDFARFDLVLVAGQKVVEQMVAHGVAPDRLRITGYPKFDSIDWARRFDPFGNGRPTFVYNPHFDPKLSSWYDMGPDLLRWFAGPQGQAFNLVFAPHVMLFRKALHISPEYRVSRRRPEIPAAALDAPNIHIDVESPRLFDMTHILSADAYIGDMSSQIYEFLARPRPAFFLNARGAEGHDEDEGWHMHWRAGPVVDGVDELTRLLPQWQSIGARYRDEQQRLFDWTFDRTDRPAAERVAAAIDVALR